MDCHWWKMLWGSQEETRFQWSPRSSGPWWWLSHQPVYNPYSTALKSMSWTAQYWRDQSVWTTDVLYRKGQSRLYMLRSYMELFGLFVLAGALFHSTFEIFWFLHLDWEGIQSFSHYSKTHGGDICYSGSVLQWYSHIIYVIYFGNILWK